MVEEEDGTVFLCSEKEGNAERGARVFRTEHWHHILNPPSSSPTESLNPQDSPASGARESQAPGWPWR